MVNFFNFSNLERKGQEEMVGFALILILLAVAILVLIVIAANRPSEDFVQSYEVESFLQSSLQYTTTCEDNLEFKDIQKLIFDCKDKDKCLNGRSSCEVLNKTLIGLVNSGWPVGEARPVKGYDLKVLFDQQEFLSLSEGNKTGNSKGSIQEFARGGSLAQIFFKAYF